MGRVAVQPADVVVVWGASVSNYHHSGPAFPVHETPDSTDSPGMTLRDYFAANALQGAAARGWPKSYSFDEVARDCYMVADAMLAERAK